MFDDGQSINLVNSNFSDTEKKLNRSQRIEAIGSLTGGIAHDFNNMLSVMIGNIELLELDLSRNLGHENRINKLKAAVERASSLTSRLLAFSRQQPLLPRALNISILFDDINDLLLRTVDESITLAVSVAPDIWWIKVDASQLDQCLINLAVNARDAMPEGGSLIIEARNHTECESTESTVFDLKPGDYVEILIKDDGCGISSENKFQIFEPFYTTKDVGKGSGLGLSMVHGFIEQSDGHVKIESKVGHGTSIYLYLPRLLEVPLEEIAKQQSSMNLSGTETILIVEDEPQLREIAVRLLQNQGYTVLEARDGAEAINLLTNNTSIDLLFTDIVLPGNMNGMEISKQALQLQPDIKILFASGYTQDVFSMDHELKEVILLDKPYRSAELIRSVRRLLDENHPTDNPPPKADLLTTS
ncbi:MAG: ATP-binding protein [Gammaproteobacteria bacterium]|nr:ATP-binding protein [Gammaproteobacteria bacterium]MDP6733950.1 ATP-binding protein [Gammaproteobacteria bacterium]